MEARYICQPLPKKRNRDWHYRVVGQRSTPHALGACFTVCSNHTYPTTRKQTARFLVTFSSNLKKIVSWTFSVAPNGSRAPVSGGLIPQAARFDSLTCLVSGKKRAIVGIAQRLVHRLPKPRMAVRFCLPTLRTHLHNVSKWRWTILNMKAVQGE